MLHAVTTATSLGLKTLFEREEAHGLVLAVGGGVGLGLEQLVDAEKDLARSWAEARLRSFVAGRTALRRALERRGLSSSPLLRDDRGAPLLPTGVDARASVSHKDDVAVALVSSPVGDERVGVDVEIVRELRFDIARRVLTDDEIEEAAGLSSPDRDHFILVRFSVKEAIYKAIDPFVRRYVGFREVSLVDGPEGLAVSLRLEPKAELSVEVATWRTTLDDGRELIVSTARARQIP